MTAPAKPYAMVRTEPGAAVPFVHTTQIGKILMSEEARAQIGALIPHGVNFEHVLLEVHRATVKEPKILECTPASIIMAVGTAVQTGLEIGRTIHLVPVDGKLQAWNDYKGDIELVIWSGAARHVDAQVVYANDVFELELGSAQNVVHRPAKGNRGAPIGAYCIAFLNAAGTLKKIVWLPLEDIEKVRAKSRSWSPRKVADCPPWYMIKTAVHLNTKMLPKNRRLAAVLQMMDSREAADIAEVDPQAMLDEDREFDNPLDAAPSIAPASVTEPQPAEATPAETPAVTGPAVGTLEWALAYPFPFQQGKPAYGKPTGERSTDHLESIEKWIAGKREEKGDPTWNAEIYEAISLILASRQDQTQTALGLDEEPPEPPAAAVDTRLAPGKIEDAISKPVPAAPAPPTFAALASRAALLLKDPKLTPDERAEYKKTFDKADNAEKMAALVAELERFLKVPF